MVDLTWLNCVSGPSFWEKTRKSKHRKKGENIPEPGHTKQKSFDTKGRKQWNVFSFLFCCFYTEAEVSVFCHFNGISPVPRSGPKPEENEESVWPHQGWTRGAQHKQMEPCMRDAQSILDACAKIRTQILWCCLCAVWTPPFTSTGPICFASRSVWIGPHEW